jgi:hypothetical protein
LARPKWSTQRGEPAKVTHGPKKLLLLWRPVPPTTINMSCHFHQCSNCLTIHHFEQFCRWPRRKRIGQSSSSILKQQ